MRRQKIGLHGLRVFDRDIACLFEPGTLRQIRKTINGQPILGKPGNPDSDVSVSGKNVSVPIRKRLSRSQDRDIRAN